MTKPSLSAVTKKTVPSSTVPHGLGTKYFFQISQDPSGSPMCIGHWWSNFFYAECIATPILRTIKP